MAQGKLDGRDSRAVRGHSLGPVENQTGFLVEDNRLPVFLFPLNRQAEIFPGKPIALRSAHPDSMFRFSLIRKAECRWYALGSARQHVWVNDGYFGITEEVLHIGVSR